MPQCPTSQRTAGPDKRAGELGATVGIGGVGKRKAPHHTGGEL